MVTCQFGTKPNSRGQSAGLREVETFDVFPRYWKPTFFTIGN